MINENEAELLLRLLTVTLEHMAEIANCSPDEIMAAIRSGKAPNVEKRLKAYLAVGVPMVVKRINEERAAA